MEAITHPIRSKLITSLARESATAAELATELGEPARTVRYHLRYLRDRGFVVARRLRAKRNTYEYAFADSTFGYLDDRTYAELKPAEKRTTTNHALGVITRGVSRFVAAGTTYEPHLPCTARVTLELDERGWQELIEICSTTLEQLVALKDEITDRLPTVGEEAFEAEVALLAFETPATESDESDG